MMQGEILAARTPGEGHLQWGPHEGPDLAPHGRSHCLRGPAAPGCPDVLHQAPQHP